MWFDGQDIPTVWQVLLPVLPLLSDDLEAEQAILAAYPLLAVNYRLRPMLTDEHRRWLAVSGMQAFTRPTDADRYPPALWPDLAIMEQFLVGIDRFYAHRLLNVSPVPEATAWQRLLLQRLVVAELLLPLVDDVRYWPALTVTYGHIYVWSLSTEYGVYVARQIVEHRLKPLLRRATHPRYRNGQCTESIDAYQARMTSSQMQLFSLIEQQHLDPAADLMLGIWRDYVASWSKQIGQPYAQD